MIDQNRTNHELTEADSLRVWDAVVIGAGPAGSVCARQLALAGYRVLLIDKEQFPRHKPCGDLLIPDAMAVLKRLDLLEAVSIQANRLNVIKVYSPSGIDFIVPADYLALSRKRLDAILASAAVEAGAVFVREWVKAMVQSDDRVTLEIGNQTVSARIAVIATGASIDLAGNLELVSRSEPSAVAIRQYVKSSEPLNEVLLSYDRSLLPGYAWIVPLPDGWFNVGCGITVRNKDTHQSNLKGMLREFTERFEPAVRLMQTASSVSPINGAALRTGLSGLKALTSGRVICIGETTGTTFPFTGEGIGKAIHTAELASGLIDQCLKEGHPASLSRFEGILETSIKPLYRGYFLAERWLSYPWLNDFIARRIRRSRFMQTRVEEFMNETGDPSRLYSPWTIMKSYWK